MMRGQIVNNIVETNDPVSAAALKIETALRVAITANGKASLMVSGGSSPKPIYRALSHADLGWEHVTIGLVDERWVEAGQAGSNEAFIRENLLQNAAAQARFIGMKTPHDAPSQAIETLTAAFADCPQPFDVCVMGMGLDGHTASWFPNAQGLEAALDKENPQTFCAVNAQGCPVAGDYPQRMSLTLSAVLAAKDIILFIPGEAKRDVYLAASGKPQTEAPVKTLSKAGDKLCVFLSKVD